MSVFRPLSHNNQCSSTHTRSPELDPPAGVIKMSEEAECTTIVFNQPPVEMKAARLHDICVRCGVCVVCVVFEIMYFQFVQSYVCKY